MNKFLTILLMTTLASCADKKPNDTTAQKTDKIETKIVENENIDTRLKNHFQFYSIKPTIEINNIKGNQTNIQLANHKIKWFNTDDETKIKIDNDLFTLKDKVTLNIVHYGKDTVDFCKQLGRNKTLYS